MFGKLGQIGWGLNYFGRDLREQDIDDFDNTSIRPTIFTGSRPTIVTANVYQGNLDDSERIQRGSFALNLNNNDPLFIDPSNGNFFLAAGSRAIDSSLDSLDERSYLLELMNSVGLNSQGISAPETDGLGLKRIDDPNVEPSGGVGNNVFKDRGALERADFNGPRAQLIAPQDNDSVGLDLDPAANSVSIPGMSIPFFEVLLNDGPSQSSPTFGAGIDDTSVELNFDGLVTVSQDDVALTQGLDYSVVYNSTNDSILIIPAAGLWPSGSRYRVELDNTVIMDRAGNPLQANTVTGETVFIITSTNLLDFGDAPAPYPTLATDDGARHAESGLFLGANASFESNGQPSTDATADSFDDGVVLGTLFPGQLVDIFVTASGSGFLSGWIDFNGVNGWEASERIFADTRLVGGNNRISISVPDNGFQGTTYARFRFSSVTGLGVTGEAPDGEVEDYIVVVGENSWQNPTDPLDVNDDGAVVAQDANSLITELNLRQFSSPATGQLQSTRPAGSLFYDVNGDGFITGNDVIRVINAINNATAGAPRLHWAATLLLPPSIRTRRRPSQVLRVSSINWQRMWRPCGQRLFNSETLVYLAPGPPIEFFEWSQQ